ncbi:DUF4198 domain-containing protein [Phenylobacterium immobile]|uniref:DUF4198 domain-containing protein n=1 Tax=Phenylobacterium immobile TaxID=21 RepID=UPI000A8E3CC9|nr:DUF4198 domain-containing protein [Phenylobacterium immobile]
MSAASRAAIIVAGCVALLAPTAHAHRAWLLPMGTVLSGNDTWVTVDGAISNDLFYADHAAMRLDGVTAYAPDGAVLPLENTSTGKYRSTFDVRLAKPGTYKIASAGGGDLLFASYKVGTETKRWRGTQAQMATAIPKDATEVKVSSNVRRIETFITNGAPSTEVLKPTGQGLELEPITHPNDLVASEPAKFRLLIDGKPAAGVEVEVVQGDQRYRKTTEMKISTGADGVFEVKWPEAGMYWIEAGVRGEPMNGVSRNASYIATLEVLPE